MKQALVISVRFTLVTTIILGIAYPLAMTAFAHLVFPYQADGQLIVHDGQVLGSRLIGQNFTSERYFHGRPSAAGNGYDASASGGSNLAPSSQKLVTRIEQDAAKYQQESGGRPVPVDLVTASGSGLDPDISPAAALYQVHRVAQARGMDEGAVRRLVMEHIEAPQFGILGEPRVHVLELNLALDAWQKQRQP
ncbi:potassium-transporting ATPase subunit KdpC [Pseudacidobacterium ailaaui]|jgi:K+-transporting ATPase ATPase C chain|uniref:potassium-transporting ATPase subunit KdpC n=1 Tax=Pseudacidobacterium ailaaui TaxID=1382359 RepID=UPI000478FFBA|nr:potassium-transporting ATPase subunit KdpC [Pseudacidobacterium ailaaui]MBX6359887.1 potassium-transporting ATPase subunit KdpC [Pseudacidobacterium ailaaui]MCL6463982.1 potassium-transporting ATPase subunit KdpC [Pseudacidobacterium ailaaui]MDI3254815.1 potassium-transporting ATPase subunit KdpC [Bacillota bacterium]